MGDESKIIIGPWNEIERISSSFVKMVKTSPVKNK
jgi:hypothetical protein